jgi:hypothetical protein
VLSVQEGRFAKAYTRDGFRHYIVGSAETKEQIEGLITERIGSAEDLFARSARVRIKSSETWEDIEPEVDPAWFTEDGWPDDEESSDSDKRAQRRAEKSKRLRKRKLLKQLAAMRAARKKKEFDPNQPRDENGQWTGDGGSSGSSGDEGEGSSEPPSDKPSASIQERGQIAVTRAERFLAEAEDAEVEVEGQSWDDVPDDEKSEHQSQWASDNMAEFLEPHEEEWMNDIRSEAESDGEEAFYEDEDTARDVFVEGAVSQGFTRESAEEAFRGIDSNVIDYDEDTLQWDGEGPPLSFKYDAIDDEWESKKDGFVESYVQDKVDDAANGDKPDWIYERAQEDAYEAFDKLDDEDKLSYAGIDSTSSQTLETPSTYQPISDGDDYVKTRGVVRYLQDKFMEEELANRLGDPDKVNINAVEKKIWSEWKSSSTTDTGLLLQEATAQELKGFKQEWKPEQQEAIERAAISLAKYEGGSRDIDREILIKRGMEIAKAHVHATWAATQYALKEAGMEEVDVYRGLILDDTKLGRIEDVNGKQYLPELKLIRNGAASTTTDLSTANDWGGVGKKPPNPVRVVLRVRARRESIVSIPAFGQNIHSEQEVVLAGTDKWVGWDAWRQSAPNTRSVPVKSIKVRRPQRG